MELTIRVPELVRALQRVQGIVEKKTTMPILANALIKSKGKDKITVSATDLEIGLTGDYDATVVKSGAMTLGAKALYDIVRSLPEDVVTLKQGANQWVEISCGKVKYRVVGMSADSFPTLPSFEQVPFFALEPRIFKEMIEKTLYAVSTDETRYNLTGVYCEQVQGSPGLRMVATDGHRLSVIERPTQEPPAMKEGVIIPRKGLVELRKLLEEGKEGGRLGFIENSAVFEKDGITLTMRLVDGRFPDYQQVIPTTSTRRVRVNKDRLSAALKRTSLLSPDKAQGVRLDIASGTMALTANNPDLGEAREELEVEYDNEALKIGFNFRYLMDVLAVLGEEQVELELTDELSPGVIRGVGGEGYRAVIMPMRI
ncbi:MAG: DNA polymerase III subunit beta [Myxococcales bacterium]|nr:DNA polymerase III subunit beta [Myxococcales bacterium]MCB9650603.1 DNA polymerase III subunit beta [Deltaproteobacteria bacterium]